MGGSKYSFSARSERAIEKNFLSANADTLFTQSKEKKVHESMNPKGIIFREARDSEVHKHTIPIILGLDVTGSMHQIPVWLVREGLPKFMAKLIQKGITDPALLFMAIGDTECDSYPLQVGQFESGDAELDNWLTSTYLEGGGGANAGESYLLAWYLAAYHTVTDAWEKRKKKGMLFTTGDEPCLDSLQKNHIETLMGNKVQGNFTAKGLLEDAQKKWNVYHLHVMQGSAGQRSLQYWKNLLGDHCIQVDDYKNLSDIMANIIYENYKDEDYVKNNSQTVIIDTPINIDLDGKKSDFVNYNPEEEML